MVIVSLDMFLNSTQDTFVKHKNDKFYLVKGNKNSGKTISIIFKALHLKRNYCFDEKDKILFITSKTETKQVVDIFNYINKSDLYKAIIPSDTVEVHVLTFEELYCLDMGKIYTHLIIDNIEDMDKDKLTYIFSIFKAVSYSKVYFVQNSIESSLKTSEIVEFACKILSLKESVFKFRYIINEDERDEFTNISITPNIKYKGYTYKEFVDFKTKEIVGYYADKDSGIYLDKGTFLYDLTHKSVRVSYMDRKLRQICEFRILQDWVFEKDNLFFVEISDEAMGRYDLFRDDAVLVNSTDDIVHGDIVVILKDQYLYAREYYEKDGISKFVSSESIFKDIILDSSISIIGKILGYIRSY